MPEVFYVYILLCADNSYYTGATSNLNRRIYEHESGADRTAYTYSRRPVQLVWAQECQSKDEAFRLEHQVKGWSRVKKEALIQNDYQKIHEIVKKERRKREAMKHPLNEQRPERNEVETKGASTMLNAGASTAPSLRSGSAQHKQENS